MKCSIILLVLLAGSVISLKAQNSEWFQDEPSVQAFLDYQDKIFQDYSVALGDAYYNYYSGVLEDVSVLEELKANTYVHRDSMEIAFRVWIPNLSQIPDTMMRRQLIQWHNILAAAQVNDVREISQLQSTLETWLIMPDSVAGKPDKQELEKLTTGLLVQRNSMAKASGFPGYKELVLLVSGFNPEELNFWLKQIDDLTLPAYQKLIEKLKSENDLEEISIRDVFKIYANYFQCGPPDPEKGETQTVLSTSLNSLGMKYEELPIIHREMELPPPMGGQGISVEIPTNFKLVVNPGVGLSTIFHEVGHGLACVYNRIPSAVLKGYEWVEGGDCPVMSEGLAEWAAGIIQNPEWMKRNTSLSDEEIRGKQKDYKTYSPVNLRFWLYNVLLEQAIFTDPEQDLDSVRNALLKEVLLVDKPSVRPVSLVNSMYVSYPVYNHNYLFAEFIQWQIHQELENRLGSDYLFNPQTAALMQEYFYKDGEYYHWQDKLKRFTGKELDIAGYMNWCGIEMAE